MINLSGYQLNELIFKSYKSVIYRGIRNADSLPVIVKILNSEYPQDKDISAFFREFEITRKLTGSKIIRVYSIEKYNNSYAMVMEDIGGMSIAQIIQNVKLNFIEKISLAIKIAELLIQTHQHNIIHKDINPSNIIWNRSNNLIKLIDFGISTELTRELAQPVNLNILEGTIEYISPEQTGRMNRPLDYRTDLYSLGVTLYELFTGVLPFKGDDDAEIVYCHIARTPVPLNEVDKNIHELLSDIIIKLLSKNAEKRYQSAIGLKKDLEQCEQMFLSDSKIEPFPLGHYDVIDRFQIPHALYGREDEAAKLIDGFDNVTKGETAVFFISGYAGIGKSSMIQEIRKPVTGKKGYFISGKFDQIERNIPYNAIIQGLKEFVRQLLTEPQASLDKWKKKLVDSLGVNGQVIVDLIPELELIIGLQSPVIELNPVEAQYRFQKVFKELLKAFAQNEHPVVIFLDDLQWCDIATFDLLKNIFASSDLHYVMFIGAYRDNEITVGHPLMQVIEEIKSTYSGFGKSFEQIYLKPLEQNVVNLMIADTFQTSPQSTEPLTQLIYKKTQGNPFFTNQVLNTLCQIGAFRFNPEKGKWEWDLDQVLSVDISDNVVDFMVKSLEQLPPATINILKTASCFGNQFDLKTMSRVCEQSEISLGRELWIALQKEIIYSLNENYRYVNVQSMDNYSKTLDIAFCFSHDRIRQAAYSLIPQSQKAELHLKIGRELLKEFKKTNQTESIFEFTNHLNTGKHLIKDDKERNELSDLNIAAGNKAKKTTAFAVAADYFASASLLLTENEWNKTPDKYIKLSIDHATVSLLSGDINTTNELCEKIAQKVFNPIDKAAVAIIKVQALEFQGKLFEAIDEIRKSLQLLDIRLPEGDQEIGQRMQEGMGKMQQFLSKTPVEELVNLPVMNDPEKMMAMQLLFQAVPPALLTNPQLFFVSSLIMFELSLTYGVSPLSCKCFVDCGILQGTILSDFKTGYKLGEAAIALLSKFKADAFKPSVYFSFSYCSYWRKHYKESLVYYDLSYRSGVETGDIQHASYALAHKYHLLMQIGKNLIECKNEVENAMVFLNNSRTMVPLLLAQIVHYSIRKFQAIPTDGDELEFERTDNEMMGTIDKIHNLPFMGRLFEYNAAVNMIHDNYENAEKWIMMADKIIFVLLADFPIADHYLYYGLILCRKWKSAPEDERVKVDETLNSILSKIRVFVANCPENYSHKLYLLEAEIGIIHDEPLEKIAKLFKMSIDSIGHNDFLQIKAFCNELQGKFWLEKGFETIGKAYIHEAYYLYKQWGAFRKVALMENLYPQYLSVSEEIGRRTRGSRSTKSSIIDMASILKSTQAISSEIKIEKLLTILIRTIIENAGAQQGCLILKSENNNEYHIAAQQEYESGKAQVLQPINYTQSKNLCHEIVQYVIITKESIVLNDACNEGKFQNNQYITENHVKSVLCMPVIYQNSLKGVVYLENNLVDNVFTSERLEVLGILASQASISIDNAIHYEHLEEKVKERTVQLKSANEKLAQLSLLDPLTNLHNRRYLYEFVSDTKAKFIRNKIYSITGEDKRDSSVQRNIFGIFMVDIDHFKDVNDTYGHQAGDKVLITISQVLKSLIRVDDFIVRWGGEEFLIVLNSTKIDYLESFSKKVLKTVSETPIEVADNKTIFKTCSLGFVMVPTNTTMIELLTLEQTINLSDYALYCAKENGRNCAAQFKVKPQEKNDTAFRTYLLNISKCTPVNNNYIEIQYFQPVC
jgi:diguanylate cyclase (GGDEF)-like protein